MVGGLRSIIVSNLNLSQVKLMLGWVLTIVLIYSAKSFQLSLYLCFVISIVIILSVSHSAIITELPGECKVVLATIGWCVGWCGQPAF